MITNTNCASSFDSHLIHTQLHLFALQHLPEIQRMQFTCTIAPITVKRAPFPCSCAIVLACRNAIANYHILAQTKYKPKQTTSTKTEHKPIPPHAHYQLLSAHTNKHVWHYQLFMFLKTCTNCRGRRVSLPPPVYCGRQGKGQEGYMGPGHGGLGTHTPYKRHRYMEPWHECVDTKRENQKIVTNIGRRAY